MTESVYIVESARSPIGTFLGSLSSYTPIDLGTHVAKAVIERSGAPADAFDASVFANVVTSRPRDVYTPRAVALQAGLPQGSHAYAVNRLCGSGVQAIVSAAQQMVTGDSSLALVGGTEVMSAAPYSIPGMRKGIKMGDGTLDDWLTGALTDPMGNGIMGITAENIAERYGISRERQDEYALESQRRARAAIDEGRFAGQIVPVPVRGGEFTTDEHPRETSLDKLGALRPTFRKDGTVTAGNSSGINDAAAVTVMASQAAVDEHGLNPQARVVSWGIAGCDPKYMGLGPVQAVPKALKKAGLSLGDIDLIESNEAFAAQCLAVSDQLGFDPDKTNVDGGAIALGHPIGATGVILTTKLISRLRATGGRYGLVTLCIGGGQGIALILEV
ncbi:acetyl-CoA C-acyltransferase [Corynebacterium mastitidis]|uniref:Probable acetyl-CoA acetyltransferase n=1 Tax=Corynebacterium mastitidis TaxID=161890 RepID=A0A2N0X5Z6_9CORY|nr:acetyl-CoA C-acyltransferase [Corynebacterium mastitidis]MCH6196875.1 acetyl-CoA C-acyltransferase [Corynebacterium mastitidis]PKF68128.1 acetyl-CoA C-acyltransferase [Corynebacterium mastitidis]